MKQYLNACICVSKILTRQKKLMPMWKEINLLRVCCEFHYQNVETFRSLHGYIYLEIFIWETYLALLTKDTERSISNVCEEIVRAFDVIGLRS